jgi:hypothetical protein
MVVAILCFLGGFWCGHIYGKNETHKWWLNRITSKDVPKEKRDHTILEKDIYCVEVRDYGSVGFIAQPVDCERVHP